MVVKFPVGQVANNECAQPIVNKVAEVPGARKCTWNTAANKKGIGSVILDCSHSEQFSIEADGFVDEGKNLKSHAAEPIKRIEDICAVQDYLIKEKRYRDNLLFTCGINFGLRVSDLLTLKIGHLITEDGTAYRDRIVLTEQKTGKRRVVYMNDAVMDAADLYFTNLVAGKDTLSLNDYLFRCEGNRGKNANKPLLSSSVERILKEVINDKCGLDVHASTHCLRKTFAYQVIMNAKDRSRAIEFLQKMFGHSSQAITLRYAGITDEEIRETYQSLNLGNPSYGKWDVCTSSGYASIYNKKDAAAM